MELHMSEKKTKHDPKNEKELLPNYLGKTDQGLSKLENIDKRFQFANVFFFLWVFEIKLYG